MTAVLSPLEQSSRDAALETPEDVQMILGLTAAGWGRRRIAQELGCSPETVRKYRRQGGWEAYGKPRRIGVLDGQCDWLRERFIVVSLRTVERAVEPWRQELRAAALATVRFETSPGKQLQADFGETYARIAGERVKVHLCVLTLGYSRRLVVRACRHERQVNWLLAMEEAFRHWRGVPAEVLFDNARALVKEHDPSRQVLIFNERLDVCPLLGIHPQSLPALPSPHQGEGRARRRLRQDQCGGRPGVRQLAGAGGPSGALEPGGGRRSHPRNDR